MKVKALKDLKMMVKGQGNTGSDIELVNCPIPTGRMH